MDTALDLIASAIDQSAASVAQAPAVNEVSALACYTRAFRGLRAAGILATESLYHEARKQARDVYESAGLARMLAKRPDKAEAWLVQERWIKDNEVRQYIENLLLPQIETESPYRRFYRDACDQVHPMARSTLPLIWTAGAAVAHFEPKLESRPDEVELEKVLKELIAVAVFVGFTILRAAAGDESWAPPQWRRALFELAVEALPDMDDSHLQRDWAGEQREYEAVQAAVVHEHDLSQRLDAHPNSQRNVHRRRDAEP